MFAFRPVASNSHNAVGFKSRRNTKQLVLLRISINLKTPRKCGVLNFYGVCSLLSNMLLVFCAKFPDMQGKYRENVNF